MRPMFHRELKTEIRGRLGTVPCVGHLFVVLHGPGTLTPEQERTLFVLALQAAIDDLNRPPTQGAP